MLRYFFDFYKICYGDDRTVEYAIGVPYFLTVACFLVFISKKYK